MIQTLQNAGAPVPHDHLETSERDFVDAMAVYYEQRGLSPVAGRILGRLLVARPAEQSSRELATYIAASKGSVSAQTQFLIQAGYVERRRRPQSRETWYRIKEGIWVDLLHREAAAAGLARQMADHVIQAQEQAGEQPSQPLLEYRSVQAFFERRMPTLIEEWRQEQSAEGRST